MEIQNTSTRYYIPLIVGRRIAQLVFFETGPIVSADYATSGKYSSSTSLPKLKKSWKPEMMLPKLYTDRDIEAGAARAKKRGR
jgi:hypothetical protein